MNETSTKTPSFDGPGEGAFIMTIFLAPYFGPYVIEFAKRIDPFPVSIALEIADGTDRVMAKTYDTQKNMIAARNLNLS